MAAKSRKPVSKKRGRNPARKKMPVKPVRNTKPANPSEKKSIGGNQPPEQLEESGPKSNPVAATADAVSEIQLSPEFLRIRAAISTRWRRLGKSEEFVWETMRLKWKFQLLYQGNPDLVRQFFSPTPLRKVATFSVSLIDLRQLERRIGSVEKGEDRSLLWRYVNYAVRYGVLLQLFPKQPYFRVREGQGAIDDRFRVVIRNGDLVPSGPTPEDDAAFADGFESNVSAATTRLEQLVKSGDAKYVLIDDEDPFSLFRQMFYFAYSPDQVTVFRYNSVPRHSLFLIGQNVSLTKVWQNLRKVIAADQRSSAKRDQRGAPTELRKLCGKLHALIESTDSQSNIAARFVTDKVTAGYPQRLANMESRLSQLKRKLEE